MRLPSDDTSSSPIPHVLVAFDSSNTSHHVTFAGREYFKAGHEEREGMPVNGDIAWIPESVVQSQIAYASSATDSRKRKHDQPVPASASSSRDPGPGRADRKTPSAPSYIPRNHKLIVAELPDPLKPYDPAPSSEPFRSLEQARGQLRKGDAVFLGESSLPAQFVRFRADDLVLRVFSRFNGTGPLPGQVSGLRGEDVEPGCAAITMVDLRTVEPEPKEPKTLHVIRGTAVRHAGLDYPTAQQLPYWLTQNVTLRNAAIGQAVLLNVDTKRHRVELASPHWSIDLAYLGSRLTAPAVARRAQDAVDRWALRSIGLRGKDLGDLKSYIGGFLGTTPEPKRQKPAVGTTLPPVPGPVTVTRVQPPAYGIGWQNSWYRGEDGIYHYAVVLEDAEIAVSRNTVPRELPSNLVPHNGAPLRRAALIGPFRSEDCYHVLWDRKFVVAYWGRKRTTVVDIEPRPRRGGESSIPRLRPVRDAKYRTYRLDRAFSVPIPPKQGQLLACLHAHAGDTAKFVGIAGSFRVRQTTVRDGIGYVAIERTHLPPDLLRHCVSDPTQGGGDPDEVWISLDRIGATFPPGHDRYRYDDGARQDAYVVSRAGEKIPVHLLYSSDRDHGTASEFHVYLASHEPVPWFAGYEYKNFPTDPPTSFRHIYAMPFELASLRYGNPNPACPPLLSHLGGLQRGAKILVAGHEATFLFLFPINKFVAARRHFVHQPWVRRDEVRAHLVDLLLKGIGTDDESANTVLVQTSEEIPELARICRARLYNCREVFKGEGSPITSDHFYLIPETSTELRATPGSHPALTRQVDFTTATESGFDPSPEDEDDSEPTTAPTGPATTTAPTGPATVTAPATQGPALPQQFVHAVNLPYMEGAPAILHVKTGTGVGDDTHSLLPDPVFFAGRKFIAREEHVVLVVPAGASPLTHAFLKSHEEVRVEPHENGDIYYAIKAGQTE
jgi:hypothetical protein